MASPSTGGWRTTPLAEAPLDAAIAATYGPGDQPLVAWSALYGATAEAIRLFPANRGELASGREIFVREVQERGDLGGCLL